MSETSTAALGQNNDIVYTRVFDAPRELVFDAWTDPEHIAQWWGPNGFSITIEKMDVRPGGEWIYVMHGPDGRDYPNYCVFMDVRRPSLIVKTHGGSRKDAEPESIFHMTATFETVEQKKTLLTMRQTFTSPEQRDRIIREYGAMEGAKQTLERLATFLAAKEVLA